MYRYNQQQGYRQQYQTGQQQQPYRSDYQRNVEQYQNNQQTGQAYGTSQQTGMRMEEPPQVISNKDLLYLQDALSWELVASKKAFHFADECQDPDIRQTFERAGEMHHRHYQTLLRHLQTESQSTQFEPMQ